MPNETYQVVLTGELAQGVSQEKVLGEFATLCQIEMAKAVSIFKNTPIVVKRNLGEKNAHKVMQSLKKIGLGCEMVSMNVEKRVGDIKNAHGHVELATTATNPIIDPEKYLGLPYTIEGRPDYSFLTVRIPKNHTLKVEASSMATMDTHIVMKTRAKGGFTRFLAGEQIFVNEFTADSVPGDISIAPSTPGDIFHQYLDGETLYLQNSAFVASTLGVKVEAKWQGMVKGFFSGEKLFLIRCSGVGDLWFNTYGAMIEIDVTEDYVVDTGNIVAFTQGLEYHVSRVGGYKSLFFSGEGFVCRFKGRGKVWIQTRSVAGLAAWARMFRPRSG